ncbi:MAG: ABC transporter ATP-binding protein [Alphaproteobacteria bacterium]
MMLMTTSTWYLLKRLWKSYIRYHKGKIGSAFFFMALSAGSTAWLAKLMQPIIDDVFKSENVQSLRWVATAVLSAFLIKGIAAYGESIVMNRMGQRILSDLQYDLLSHLIRADLAFFQNNSTGTLISRCTNDINLMRGVVSNTLTSLGKDLLMVIFLVAVMFENDWVLAALTFFVFPLAVYPIVRIGKKMRKVSTFTQEQTGSFLSLLNELFHGTRLVKAFNMEEYERDRAKKTIESLFKLALRSNRIRSLSSPIMETLGGIAIVIVIFYGGYQVIQHTNTAGAFFSFITALLLAYEPMKRLANLNANLQEGLAATRRVFDLMDIEPTIQNSDTAQDLPVEKGQIELQNVHFQYTPKKPVLKNLTLKIPAGKKVALVGESGSGKSTLLNLIPRFYEVDKGTILIDNIPLKNFTLESLRSNLSLVSQEITLFNDTVRANILYGKPDATEAEIVKAAKDAAAHSFILKLPHGYDTFIGESGLKLSGGQRQRISIARALLKNAPILLLDEATSALDTTSERHVQKALDQLMKGRTCLIIAHRLSTVKNADRIIVLDEGQIVEEGTHDALVKRKGIYAQLCQWQLVEDAHA